MMITGSIMNGGKGIGLVVVGLRMASQAGFFHSWAVERDEIIFSRSCRERNGDIGCPVMILQTSNPASGTYRALCLSPQHADMSYLVNYRSMLQGRRS